MAETLFKEFENAKENFCLFVTDGAAYCVKAGKALKVFFPSMVHVTCVAHATHLAFEDVRKKSEKANLCIVSLKSLLSKFADISAQEELLELFPLEPALQYQTKLESHGSTLVEQFDTLQQFQDAVYGT